MTDDDTEWGRRRFTEKLTQLVQERLRFVAANEEKLVEAWLAETGLKPSESMIVRQDMPDGSIRMWVQRREGT